MDRFSQEDLTLSKPLDLLARYRLLCENAGACRATDTPYPRELREQLTRVEGELQTRLWLAWADGRRDNGVETPLVPRSGAAASSISPTRLPGRRRSGGGSATEGAYLAETGGSDGAALETARVESSVAAMVFCDGACIGNPGPGGYGVVVRVPGQPERTISAGKARTTNNEMELTAAVEGLKAAISLGATEITVVTDSEYLVKGMTGWLKGWLRNGWKTASGTSVKNRPLWEELHRLSQGRTVTWIWTRGHNGHPENERCDALAVAAAQEAGRGMGHGGSAPKGRGLSDPHVCL